MSVAEHGTWNRRAGGPLRITTERRPFARARLAGIGALVLGTLGGLVGCGGGSDTTTNCATETRAQVYRPGMQQRGDQGALNITLVDSTPGPPLKGDNTWTLQITDLAGAAQPGATLTVTPYMPDHRHGTSVKPMTTDQGGGKYSVSPLNLFMPGLWTVTIAPRTAAGTADSTVFSFCIEG